MAQLKNCAFQYYAEEWYDMKCVKDVTGITLDKAKLLFNKYYSDMVDKAKKGRRLEVAIWVDMDHDAHYHKTLIHLHNPEVENGELIERITKNYARFPIGQVIK